MGYMRATRERSVATFGWNALESEEPVYRRRKVQSTARRRMSDMTMIDDIDERRLAHFCLLHRVDGNCIIQGSKYTLGITG